nr:Cyclin-L1 like [Ipomoea batatas]
MTILFESASTSALSLRILLISTTVISAAVMLKISAPAITDFAVSEVPSIWNAVVSWLRPPYLYLVINCIIITIVASSKLQSKLDDHVSAPPPDTHVQALPQVREIQPPATVFSDLVPSFSDVVLNNQTASTRPEVFSYSDSSTYEAKVESAVHGRADAVTESAFTFRLRSHRLLPDSVTAKTLNPLLTVNRLYTFRRELADNGGKGALAVSKPKRQDTLESTWKTITEGRAMPLTRHLRKSDTWETHGGRSHLRQEKMTKSETFNDRSTAAGKSSSPSPLSARSAKLRKEPSLGQDELNRRVEAFIKKFNEEMRMQRQESLNQYKEMINRRAH